MKHPAYTGRLRRALWVLLCLAALLWLAACGKQTYAPPVIQGVPAPVTLQEGIDPAPRLLDGVTGVGAEDRPDAVFDVTVSVYDQDGKEVSDFPPGTYRVVYLCEDGSGGRTEAETVLTITPADTEPPVISGTKDLEVAAGGTLLYREGVTVTDNMDSSVRLEIDSSGVNLAEPGLYFVRYSAADSSGNRAEVTVQVTVTEPLKDTPTAVLPPIPDVVTQEMVDELSDKVLGKIVNDGMSLREKAYQVYRYVYSHIKYVGTSDKSDWLRGAYVGFAHGRGDCYNYFACSKALLTRLGIPTVDLQRVGGTSRHYWQLINVGDGWYHFDACWHPTGHAIESFMLTEQQVRDYTEEVSSVRLNYYVYDYAACPVTVVGTPAGGEEVPAPEPEVPGAEPETPSAEPEAPSAEPEAPSAEPKTPSAEPEAPNAEPEAPSAEPETPSAEPEAPNAEPEAPNAEPESPSAGPETPSAEPETPETTAPGGGPAAEGVV